MPIKKRIDIFILDEPSLTRDALAYELQKNNYFSVQCFSNPNPILDWARQQKTGMVIMEPFRGKKDGIHLIKKLKTANQNISIAAFSKNETANAVLNSIEAGVDIYLFKEQPWLEVIEGIVALASEKPIISQLTAKKTLQALANKQVHVRDTLTQKEWDIFNMVGEGLSNTDIAREFFISESTVRVHIHNLYLKLNLSNRGQLKDFQIKYENSRASKE